MSDPITIYPEALIFVVALLVLLGTLGLFVDGDKFPDWMIAGCAVVILVAGVCTLVLSTMLLVDGATP